MLARELKMTDTIDTSRAEFESWVASSISVMSSITDYAWKAWQAARAQPIERGVMSDNEIRNIFMRHGFTIKGGQGDLKPYVYEAARSLLAAQANMKGNK
jgi:hypothetical protein